MNTPTTITPITTMETAIIIHWLLFSGSEAFPGSSGKSGLIILVLPPSSAFSLECMEEIKFRKEKKNEEEDIFCTTRVVNYPL